LQVKHTRNNVKEIKRKSPCADEWEIKSSKSQSIKMKNKKEPQHAEEYMVGDFVDDMYRTRFGIKKKKKKGSGNLFSDIKKFVVDEVKKDTKGLWK